MDLDSGVVIQGTTFVLLKGNDVGTFITMGAIGLLEIVICDRLYGGE